MPRQFRKRSSYWAEIDVTQVALFEYLDDPARLAGPMSRSSWMMGGGRMQISTDEGGGMRVGSHIRLSGRAFGLALSLDEVVTEYKPPTTKVWETVDEPNLLVIGAYRMGFRVESGAAQVKLQVFIEYDLARTGLARVLGSFLGGLYASGV